MKRGIVCKHCGSPARNNPCWWENPGDGSEPPCFIEAYDEGMAMPIPSPMRVVIAVFVGLILACLAALVAIGKARAEDNPGSWWQQQAVRACCSDADAVYADDWTINPDGTVRATVTGRWPRNHAWAPIGKTYDVPADKILREPGNPTGRPLLFLRSVDLHLYCFALGAGI